MSRKADFERLLKQGKRLRIAGFAFYYERRSGGGPRLGMLVTRKHSAAANGRNRIKRYIREAFRLEQHTLGALDLLIRPPEKPATPAMLRDLRAILARLDA